MRKVQLFNVAPTVPEELRFLETLSYNMWWCWNYDAIELFRRIHPELWNETEHTPLKFLGLLPQKRLEGLVKDAGFMSHYRGVKDRFEREVAGDGETGTSPESIRVAYFSLEYGIHESIRLYAGGLGCLSGDHLKSASDLAVPLVAVGLLYRCGYFQQYLNDDGWQQEACPMNEVHRLPLKRALDAQGNQIRVSVPLPDGNLQALVWRLDVGRVPLFFLDANIPENPPEVQNVAHQLYEGDRNLRLRQELLLGIGGYRALLALGYEPMVCHMNEGHAAFVSFARIARLVKDKGVDVDAAMEVVRRSNVFTTHTPVPAGNESFPADLAKKHFQALAGDLGIDADRMLEWGRAPNALQSKEVTMTVLALRMAQHANAVSKLHERVSRKMWQHLWPDRPEDEIPIQHVTNGIHVPSWISSDVSLLFDRYLGPEWRTHPPEEKVHSRVDQIPDDELWRTHELCRARLVRAARSFALKQFAVRQASRTEISQIKGVLQHDVLTIGFARRFAAYKRATLLLKNPERLEAILNHKEYPMQIVFSGKAHPDDEAGKDLIRKIVHFARKANVRQRIIFLENYDIRLARYLVQGVDVWLNTPRRPQEASGTSGMKAAVNGVLNVSVLDGWWDEGYSPESGWAIGHGEEYDNVEYQDSVESHALYNLLENEIAPAFYDRADSDLPLKWIAMMKGSIKMALSYFTSHRMVSEYSTKLYGSAQSEYESLLANDAARARDLVTRHHRLRDLWGQVKIDHPNTEKSMTDLHVGDRFGVVTTVHLGELTPDEVDVEVYFGPVNSENQIEQSYVQSMTVAEDRGKGVYVYKQEIECNATGRYGFTARVTPRGTDWKGVIPGFICWANEVA